MYKKYIGKFASRDNENYEVVIEPFQSAGGEDIWSPPVDDPVEDDGIMTLASVGEIDAPVEGGEDVSEEAQMPLGPDYITTTFDFTSLSSVREFDSWATDGGGGTWRGPIRKNSVVLASDPSNTEDLMRNMGSFVRSLGWYMQPTDSLIFTGTTYKKIVIRANNIGTPFIEKGGGQLEVGNGVCTWEGESTAVRIGFTTTPRIQTIEVTANKDPMLPVPIRDDQEIGSGSLVDMETEFTFESNGYSYIHKNCVELDSNSGYEPERKQWTISGSFWCGINDDMWGKLNPTISKIELWGFNLGALSSVNSGSYKMVDSHVEWTGNIDKVIFGISNKSQIRLTKVVVHHQMEVWDDCGMKQYPMGEDFEIGDCIVKGGSYPLMEYNTLHRNRVITIKHPDNKHIKRVEIYSKTFKDPNTPDDPKPEDGWILTGSGIHYHNPAFYVDTDGDVLYGKYSKNSAVYKYVWVGDVEELSIVTNPCPGADTYYNDGKDFELSGMRVFYGDFDNPDPDNPDPDNPDPDEPIDPDPDPDEPIDPVEEEVRNFWDNFGHIINKEVNGVTLDDEYDIDQAILVYEEALSPEAQSRLTNEYAHLLWLKDRVEQLKNPDNPDNPDEPFDPFTKYIDLSVPPFVVKYEGTSDLNKPMKLSNATINMLTTRIPWELVTQKANDVKVTLIRKAKGNRPEKIMWVGYVEPSVYTMDANYNLEEFSINCIDALTALQYRYYGKGHTESITTPQTISFLDYILDAFKPLPYKSIYFPEMYREGGNNRVLLENYLVNENTFIDDKCFSVDDSGPKFVFEKNDTYKDVLEKLMLFLNLTMVASGESVYLLPIDYLERDYTYKVYNISQGEVTGTTTANIKETVELEKLFQPTTYSLTEQYNQVSVTAKMKEYGSLIPDIFDDKYLTNTTVVDGLPPQWDSEIKQRVDDNQKGDLIVTDDCRWRFFKHRYWKSHFYDADDVPIEGGTPLESARTLDDIQNYSCGQIMKYGCSPIVNDDTKYKDHPLEKNLDNYVALLSYRSLGALNTVMLETQNMPEVYIFDNSYLCLKYSVIFRPNNGSPWHIPSSWKTYDKDKFSIDEIYLPCRISCTIKIPKGTKYMANDGVTQMEAKYDMTVIYTYRNTPTGADVVEWEPIGHWEGSTEGVNQYTAKLPLQAEGQTDHLYGKTWKNLITSGLSGNQGVQEDGFIVPINGVLKENLERIGIRNATFNVKLMSVVMRTSDNNHTTQGTWIKDFSVKLNVPKDESIKDWSADTEYSAMISDQYVKEGEKITMHVNTYDARVPSYSCVHLKGDGFGKMADVFHIDGQDEIPHRMEEWKIYHKVKQHNVPRKILNTTIYGLVDPYAIFDHQGEKFVVNEWEMDYYDNKSNVELVEVWTS